MFEFRNGSLRAESVPLEAIAREFGMPCYVYSRAALAAPLLQALDKILGLLDRLAAEGIHLHHLDLGGAWAFVTGMKRRRTSALTCARYSNASGSAS